jgi:hypothetical protein
MPPHSPLSDLDARADRVRQIAESLFGKVLSHDGDTLRVEVPADLSMSFCPMISASGPPPIYIGQRTGIAERRVTDASGRIIPCPGDMVTTCYYVYEIALAPREVRVNMGDPHAGAVMATRQVKPAV